MSQGELKVNLRVDLVYVLKQAGKQLMNSILANLASIQNVLEVAHAFMHASMSCIQKFLKLC